jgi:hypothetical protein
MAQPASYRAPTLGRISRLIACPIYGVSGKAKF